MDIPVGLLLCDGGVPARWEVLRPAPAPTVPLVSVSVSRCGPLAISIDVRFKTPIVLEAEFSVLGSALSVPSVSA